MSNIFIQITFLFLLLVMPEITKSGCKSSKDSEVITPNINVSRTTDASSSSSYPNLGERITCSCGQTFYEWEEVRIGEINLIKNTIKIFHGATGQIFHAYSQQTNKCLIIKEIFLEVEDDRERTRQEWMANNELNILLYFKTRNLNERIVEIIDYGNLYEDRGKCFVMEQGNETLFRYMNDVKDRFSTINISPNGTSRRIYREKKRFGRIILQIMLEVAKAIHEFHKYAIHLDIKSTNFICFRKGNKRCFVKLIDFNSSVLLNGQNEVEAFSYGACNYKSYEIRGREDMDIDQTFMVTTKSDIMSFGLMFYFFLHFEIEFNELNISESYNIIDQNLINFHQSITKSSNYLDRVIKACTHYEPTERPSAWAIINFIENRCHVFASEEQEEYEIICEELEN